MLSQRVIGTFLNAGAIVLGGIAGFALRKPMSAASQFFVKATLGAFTVFFGLKLTLTSFSGSFLQIMKQFVIVLLALMLGNLVGKVLHLQKSSNRIGQFARERMAAARSDNAQRFNDGFMVCMLLFCAAPLGILGAIQDGLSNYYYPLAVKAVMDGLATMGFFAMFGWGVVLSAVPVLVFQGTITLLCARFFLPVLAAHNLLNSVNATGGLLVFCVALLIFEVQKVQVTNYLPSLAIAPVLTWIFR